jgi:hypothetical protein
MITKTAREHVLSFRTTIENADELKREARKHGLGLSDYLNNVVLNIGKEDNGQC